MRRGDCEASGIDGLEMHLHGNPQDHFGPIMKAGKLVVHGDVGQTFKYGAKGAWSPSGATPRSAH